MPDVAKHLATDVADAAAEYEPPAVVAGGMGTANSVGEFAPPELCMIKTRELDGFVANPPFPFEI